MPIRDDSVSGSLRRVEKTNVIGARIGSSGQEGLMIRKERTPESGVPHVTLDRFQDCEPARPTLRTSFLVGYRHVALLFEIGIVARRGACGFVGWVFTGAHEAVSSSRICHRLKLLPCGLHGLRG